MTDYVSKHSGPAIDGAIDKVPVLEQKKVEITNGNATGLTLNGTTTATGNINCDETVTSFKATIDEATITAGYIEDGFITNTNLGDGTLKVNGDEAYAEIGHLKLTFDDGGYNSLFKPIDDSTVAFKEIDYIDCQALNVRGNLNVYELTANKVRSTNGYLYVTDSDTISEVVGKQQALWLVKFTESNFIKGDVILIQKREGANITANKFGIVSITNDVFAIVYLNDGIPVDETSPYAEIPPVVNDYCVRIDSNADDNRKSGILLSPYDGSYIDFYKGNGNGQSKTIMTSIGDLTHLNKSGVEGYGLYSENAHLKGEFFLNNGKSVVEAAEESIKLSIDNAGINIESGEVTLKGDKVNFTDRTGTKSHVNINPDTGTLVATNAHLTGEFYLNNGKTVLAATEESIKMAIEGNTGIDIDTGEITLRGDKVRFTDKTGNTSKVSIDPNTGTLSATNAHLTGEFILNNGKSVVEATEDAIKLSLGDNTGIDIETGEITLKGDKVRFTDSTGTKSLVSIDPDSGALVASEAIISGDITTNRMIATDSNNKMLSSVNLNGQGEYIQYRSDENNTKLMEFNNGSIIYYDADGSIKWILGESGTIQSLAEYWADAYWFKTDSTLSNIAQNEMVRGVKYKEFKATVGSANQQYIGLTVLDDQVLSHEKPQNVATSKYIPDGIYTVDGQALVETSLDGSTLRAFRWVVTFLDGKSKLRRKLYYA